MTTPLVRMPASAAPDVQAAFRDVQRALTELLGGNNIDLHGRRIINAGDAQAAQDYVTKADLDGVQTTTAATTTPRPTNALLTVGTHATRLATAPGGLAAGGAFFYENDRMALYAVATVAGANAWILLAAAMPGSLAGRPSDLGSNEEGFVYYAQDLGIVYYWSGAAWHLEVGTLVDAFANRPAASALVSGGFRFGASDYGYQEWVFDFPNNWWTFVGGGVPMQGALASKPSLGTHDAGFRYWATDYDRLYVWTGSAWADGPGQPARGQVVLFTVNPGTGWATCDGTNATFSTATGGTSTVATPNLLDVAHRYLAGAASVGQFGSVNHTHSIDPPATASGNPSTTFAVDAGAARAVANFDMTVTTDIAAFNSGIQSADPAGWSGFPYVRL